MRFPSPPMLAVLALLGAGATTLGGCGSQTKTVSVTGGPTLANTTPTHTQTQTQSTGATTTSTTSSTAPPTTTSTSEAPSTTTHTATEPAFTHTESQSEALSQAVTTLQAHGYSASNTSQYHAGQTLRVLVGTKAGAGEGYDQQAFFFIGERYIGTDTKEPSASVNVVSQGDTEVTLAYPLYRTGDPISSPSGGQATVRFQLNDGKLVALDAIPPASSASAPSRR